MPHALIIHTCGVVSVTGRGGGGGRRVISFPDAEDLYDRCSPSPRPRCPCHNFFYFYVRPDTLVHLLCKNKKKTII